MFYITMEEFISKNLGRVFRFWTYRKLYTPYELEQKFSDETVYEDDHASFGYLKEAIKLDNGDYLLGFEMQDIPGYIEYRPLSRITLALFDADQDGKDLE